MIKIFIILIILIILFIVIKNNNSNNKVIVIGSGLAGLAATCTLLDKGIHVILIEKQQTLGGNSSKASSGINASNSNIQKINNIIDSNKLFYNDTLKSSKRNNEPYIGLINQLVDHSSNAIEWLQNKNINLNNIAILGGHTNPRTHRPDSNVLVGIEIISKLSSYIKNNNNLTVMTDTSVINFLKDNNTNIIGVTYEDSHNNRHNLYANCTILATGGYGNDHTKLSLLYKYRPDLKNLPTTNTGATTGDGIKMGQLIGALTSDLNEIQVHPTGFIDPVDITNKTKTLCAEVMRGVGGILLNLDGNRFCNELGTRQYIVDKMNEQIKKQKDNKFIILLNENAIKNVTSHLNHYITNKLIIKMDNGTQLANKLNISSNNLKILFNKYKKQVQAKKDEFGKTVFNSTFNMNDVFYYGYVTPVIHYCMGGLQITDKCEVLSDNGIINNLYAAGEVTSGIHGSNRLGGNSLLECTVYGRIAGEQASKGILPQNNIINTITRFLKQINFNIFNKKEILQNITVNELKKHNKLTDAWIVIDNKVYDVTNYIDKHPGGKNSILRHAGTDATKAFYQIHESYMLDDLKNNIIGII